MPATAYAHHGHTVNTCRLTKCHSMRQSVCTHVLVAGSQGIRQRGPMRVLQTFPPPSCYAQEKLAVVPRWPCRCGYHLSSLLLPEYLLPQLIFQESFQVPPPPGRPPCSALFCSLTLNPSVLLLPKECVSRAPVIFQGAHLFTHLSSPIKLKVLKAKNSAFFLSVFSSLVVGTRSILNECLLSD